MLSRDIKLALLYTLLRVFLRVIKVKPKVTVSPILASKSLALTVKLLLDRMHLVKILDVCSWDARIVVPVVKRTVGHVYVVACDLSLEGYYGIRSMILKYGVDFVRCDASSLPFRSKSLDIVVCNPPYLPLNDKVGSWFFAGSDSSLLVKILRECKRVGKYFSIVTCSTLTIRMNKFRTIHHRKTIFDTVFTTLLADEGSPPD